jgi:hypothetical protein
MDLSKWTNHCPGIKILHSDRKFYNKFYYKITYEIANAYLVNITKSDTDLKKYFSMRVMRGKQDLIELTASQIKHVDHLCQLREFVTKFKQHGRVRTERNTVAFFTNDLDTFYHDATVDLNFFTKNLVSVSVIGDTTHKQLLDDNYVILRTDIGYKFKVNLRGGNYRNPQNLKSLAVYLKQINDQVRIGKSLLSQLSLPYKYLQGGYFYVNDLRLVDIVRLIEPSLIRSIQKVAIQ